MASMYISQGSSLLYKREYDADGGQQDERMLDGRVRTFIHYGEDSNSKQA